MLRQANRDVLTLAPFCDAGYGWDRHHASSTSKDEFISSVGVGCCSMLTRT